LFRRAASDKLRAARSDQLASLMRGFFITLDGIDGAGKSTHLRKLARRLKRQGYRVRATREPGGTKLGEAIRRLLVEGEELRIAPLAELALMVAARAEHIEEVIRPALARGELVLSDRFSAASYAYQGYGRGLGEMSSEPSTARFAGPSSRT